MRMQCFTKQSHLCSIMFEHGWGEPTRTMILCLQWFLGGKDLGIQQGMSVWVGSPKLSEQSIELSFVKVKPMSKMLLHCITPNNNTH